MIAGLVTGYLNHPAPAAAAPAATEKAAQASTEDTAPDATEKAAQASTEDTAPDATEMTAPAFAEEAAQASAEDTVPGATEMTAPASAEDTAPAATEEAAPASAGGTTPTATEKSAQAATENSAQAATENSAQASTEETAQDAIDYSTGKPWICSPIAGLVTKDTETSLKDDFFLAVNKDKLSDMEIPEGYSVAGTLPTVMIQSYEDIQNLFAPDASAESHDAQLALNLYSLYMDWDSRNAAGIRPLKEMVDKVDRIDSIGDLMDYFGKTPPEDLLYSVFGIDHMESLEDSSVYILTIDSAWLLMNDSSEYSKLTDYGRIRKDAARTLAVKMLRKMGYSKEEAEKKYENCFAFENQIAPAIYTYQQKNEPDYYEKANNHYTRDALKEAQGTLPILTAIEEQYGYPRSNDFLVPNPDWLARLNELMTEANLEQIKDYTIVHGSLSYAGILDRECYEWLNDYNNSINGSTGILADETAMSQKVTDDLVWPVARLYTETYLKQEDKDRISALIDDVIEEYHTIIHEADFLSDQTKARAIEKLDAIDKKVLWPDSWDKYSCDELEIVSAADRGSLWDAQKAIYKFDMQENARIYSEPVDKEKWIVPPTTFNCFYNPNANEIVIPGCFARGSIYNSEMSDEEVLAKIGVVIGHEISHAFDSSGSQFDKDGNMVSWWTEEDFEAFKIKNKKLAEFYNTIQPWEGVHLKGSIMTGEACADLGGFKAALGIASKKKDFDYDRFFKAYADLWMYKNTYQKALRYLNDVHPMSYLRVNCVVQQFDEFFEQYDIKEGDGMYLAPEDRVTIW